MFNPWLNCILSSQRGRNEPPPLVFASRPMMPQHDQKAQSTANQFRFIVGVPAVLAAVGLVVFIIGVKWQEWLPASSATRPAATNSVPRPPVRAGSPPAFTLKPPVGPAPVVRSPRPVPVAAVASSPTPSPLSPADEAKTEPASLPPSSPTKSAAVPVVGGNVDRRPPLTGRVLLKGTPPPEKAIDVSKDPNCGRTRQTPLMTRFYVTSTNGGLADVIIYIKSGLAPARFLPPDQPAVLDQRGCEYTPYVLAIQRGQPLLVRNSDQTFHNPHPSPVVPGNGQRDGVILPSGPDWRFVFAQQEVPIKFACNVHPWMFAYVAVINHPYFAVSDRDGRYTLPRPPPGKYVLSAFHRKTHGATGLGLTLAFTLHEGDDLQTLADCVVEVPAQKPQ